MTHLFDEGGLPRPFSKAPRLIVYQRELYDYAECLNLLTLVHPRRPDAAPAIARVVEDLLARWQREDGSLPQPSAADRLGQRADAPLGASRSCSEASADCCRSTPHVTDGSFRPIERGLAATEARTAQPIVGERPRSRIDGRRRIRVSLLTGGQDRHYSYGLTMGLIGTAFSWISSAATNWTGRSFTTRRWSGF